MQEGLDWKPVKTLQPRSYACVQKSSLSNCAGDSKSNYEEEMQVEEENVHPLNLWLFSLSDGLQPCHGAILLFTINIAVWWNQQLSQFLVQLVSHV